jgi:adenylate cyclase
MAACKPAILMLLMTDKKDVTSIVVLPFANLSTEEKNEFLCDGMTEAIINALAKIDQLRVISRTSSFFFKNSRVSPREIHAQLDVAIIVEGSIQISDDTLRIAAKLIRAEDESYLWTTSHDRQLSKLFEVQDEISLLIADQLREHIGHLEIAEHLADKPTQNINAYNACLQGRFHFNKWNPEDAHIALTHYEKARQLDEHFVDAYVGIADAYSFLAVAGFAPREESWARASEALQKARLLDADNPGLNYMLANEAFFTKADFAAATRYALRALAAKPTYAEAQQFISFLHALSGNLDRSLEHIRYAKSIDPLNPETRFFEAYYHYRSGNYTMTDAILSDLLKQNPKNLPALITRIYVQLKLHQVDEARMAINEIADELITPDERTGLLCLADATDGRTNTGLIEKLEKKKAVQHAHHAHSYLFLAYATLNRTDEAFALLEQAHGFKSSILLLAFSDPLAAKLNDDHRYKAFHQKLYPQIPAASPPVNSGIAQRDMDKAKAVFTQLEAFMATDLPYLNPALTLRSLAGQIQIHPNQLSWVLNEYARKNFNAFINHYRIEHFKKLATDPANAHISLIGLAYESGFNSKTVFNTAFKKEVGMTPSAYQKSRL